MRIIELGERLNSICISVCLIETDRKLVFKINYVWCSFFFNVVARLKVSRVERPSVVLGIKRDRRCPLMRANRILFSSRPLKIHRRIEAASAVRVAMAVASVRAEAVRQQLSSRGRRGDSA